MITALYVLVTICSLFLICLVLIQRGRGGGLAGAFGGVGGSSAFGIRAGDVFTRITIVTASIWIALNMLLVLLSNWRSERGASAFADDGRPSATAPALPGDGLSTDAAKAFEERSGGRLVPQPPIPGEGEAIED
ncbi:hypothetical protein BH23PLA1_BH23PLA1_22150 [soil metagenome]